MSTGLDLQFVKETYEKMPDDELVRVATRDMAGLTDEALVIVKEELKKRNLDANINKGIDAQRKTYTVEEIDEYCAIIQELPCPVSGSTSRKLNGTKTAEVMSFILFSNYRKQIIIASPEMLDKANNNALIKTLLLGWWGVPWGLIRTVQAIGINAKSKRTNHMDEPNDYLRSFVLAKIGQIETYKDNQAKLLEIISSN
ncbi:MAG TPA: hypothetical protein VNS58_00755 [Puia sp.]|nr:hypothetical protein [Puia sp.]